MQYWVSLGMAGVYVSHVRIRVWRQMRGAEADDTVDIVMKKPRNEDACQRSTALLRRKEA